MNRLKGQEGFSVIFALVFVAIVGAGVLYHFTNINIAMIKEGEQARATAETAVAEQALRAVLQSPMTYDCKLTGGTSQCQFRNASQSTHPKIKSPVIAMLFSQYLSYLACTPDTKCSVKYANGGTLTVKDGHPTASFDVLVDTPGRYSVRLKLDVPMPIAGLFGDSGCNGIFVGMGQDGSIRCESIDSARAPAGQYISEVNLNNMNIRTTGLPQNVNDCANGTQAILSYQWQGASKYAVTCANRVDPKELQ